MLFLSTLLLSMLITIALIPISKIIASKFQAMDIPNKRKIHTCPIPKCGGLPMAMGILIPIIFWAPNKNFVLSILIGAGVLILFGTIDDIKDLNFKIKFAGQFLAAATVILLGNVKIKSLGGILPASVYLPDLLAIPLTLVAIVGVTNAMNLSDGLDGLAGGMALLTYTCIGYLAYSQKLPVILLISIAVMGAIFGFLRYNTYPAELFMGDVGSQLLGFLAITLSLRLTQGQGPLNPLLPLIFLGFPVLDTLAVMTRRLLSGKSPFIADKDHFHHRLIRMGLYHNEAVMVIYVLQSVLIVSSLFFRFYSGWFLLSFYIVFSGLVLSVFSYAAKRGIKIKRYDFIDIGIKGRLRLLREKKIFIKICFRIVKVGVPLLLFLNCIIPPSNSNHIYTTSLSISMLIIILLTWFLKKNLTNGLLGLSLYLLTPFLVYQGEIDIMNFVDVNLVRMYNLSFAFLLFFVVLTVKLTRRKNGFKITPFHFLIIFIALVIPNLSHTTIQSYRMGLVAAKIIILFFSYEVLFGELRLDMKRFRVPTVLFLLLLSVRGILLLI